MEWISYEIALRIIIQTDPNENRCQSRVKSTLRLAAPRPKASRAECDIPSLFGICQRAYEVDTQEARLPLFQEFLGLLVTFQRLIPS